MSRATDRFTGIRERSYSFVKPEHLSHENTKTRKHEEESNTLGIFVLSCFRGCFRNDKYGALVRFATDSRVTGLFEAKLHCYAHWKAFVAERENPMNRRWLVWSVAAGVMATPNLSGRATQTRAEPLPRPGFHHIHMNSANPPAAIAEFLHDLSSQHEGHVAGSKACRPRTTSTCLPPR